MKMCQRPECTIVKELYIQVFGTSSSCNKKRHLEKFVKPKQYEWRMKISQRPEIPHRFVVKRIRLQAEFVEYINLAILSGTVKKV